MHLDTLWLRWPSTCMKAIRLRQVVIELFRTVGPVWVAREWIQRVSIGPSLKSSAPPFDGDLWECDALFIQVPLCVIECSGDNIVSDDFDLVCLHEGHVHKSHFSWMLAADCLPVMHGRKARHRKCWDGMRWGEMAMFWIFCPQSLSQKMSSLHRDSVENLYWMLCRAGRCIYMLTLL